MRLPRPRLLLLAVLAAGLAAPSTASAALIYGEVPPNLRPVSGVVSWTVTGATDPSAVLRTWLEYDEYAYVESVRFAPPFALTYDTRKLADGPHSFRVVYSGYGSRTDDRTWNIVVDNTPPAAPVPVGPTTFSTDAASVRLPFTAETGARAEGSICDAAGCRTIVGSDGAIGTTLGLGVNTVTVWLRDRAGNAEAARAATWTITRTSPPPPPPRPRVDPGLRIVSATASRDRRSITVGGTLAVPHTNHVSVSVRVRMGRRTKTVKRIAVTSGHGFATVLRLPSARWSAATVVARVAGSSRYLTVEKRKAVRRR